MPSGGSRPGAGRPNVRGWFKGWCRAVLEDEAVRECMFREAQTNPDFALKVAEHAFGRPSQSHDVTTRTDGPVEYVVTFAGGAGAAAAADLPDADVGLDGEDRHDG